MGHFSPGYHRKRKNTGPYKFDAMIEHDARPVPNISPVGAIPNMPGLLYGTVRLNFLGAHNPQNLSLPGH